MKRVGYGRAYGAVSIVNAISTGRGAALSVDLYTEATVRLDSGRGVTLETAEKDMDSSLVAAVVKQVSEALDIHLDGCAVWTSSTIPVAVGLKSSSSAAVATALALLDALEAEMDDLEILRNVAQASIASGTSITGALDDAAACMLGGVVVTDNRRGEVVKREVLQPMEVVIAVPSMRTYTRNFRAELLSPIRGLVEEAHRMALEGEYWKAMTLNGILHAAALGLSTEPVINALRAGAVAAGVSGTGPAVAAVAEAGRAEAVAEAMSGAGIRIIRCRTNSNHAVRGARI
ncbi:Homoserine kinase [archaeon HR01]|nr:Homoserine kinase [archaeon HR01]